MEKVDDRLVFVIAGLSAEPQVGVCFDMFAVDMPAAGMELAGMVAVGGGWGVASSREVQVMVCPGMAGADMKASDMDL